RNNPARKAPSASESPTASVNAAIPRQMVSASSREISSLHVLSTRTSKGGNSFHAATAIGTGSRIALPTFQAAAPKLAPPLAEKLGSTTVKTTTAKSSTRDSV